MTKSDDEHDRTSTAVPRTPEAGARHAFLLVLAGPQFGDVFPLPEGSEVLLGRSDQHARRVYVACTPTRGWSAALVRRR